MLKPQGLKYFAFISVSAFINWKKKLLNKKFFGLETLVKKENKMEPSKIGANKGTVMEASPSK